MTRYQRSSELFERAKTSLAGGVSSNVRALAQPPLYFGSANGTRMVDADETRVKVMTLHATKGLEANYVAIADVAGELMLGLAKDDSVSGFLGPLELSTYRASLRP